MLRTYVNNMQIFDCVSSLNGPEYLQAGRNFVSDAETSNHRK